MSAPWISTWSQGSLFWISGLWRASWQGGLFILLVWAACRWLPRLPAAARCWLWWLACLKLLLGFVWVSSLPVALLPAATVPPLALAAPRLLPGDMIPA